MVKKRRKKCLLVYVRVLDDTYVRMYVIFFVSCANDKSISAVCYSSYCWHESNERYFERPLGLPVTVLLPVAVVC